MKKTAKTKLVELRLDELHDIIARAESRAAITPEESEKLRTLVESYAHLSELLNNKNVSIGRLRQLLFGPSTEKTSNVLRDSRQDESSANTTDDTEDPASEQPQGQSNDQGGSKPPRAKRKGHGRNGAKDYTGAEHVCIEHDSLEPGQRCPLCKKGKLYQLPEPKVLVRLIGQAPVQATVYELERLRCTTCGEIFTAEAPEGVGKEKYDATSRSMIAVLKYGSGLPFNRLQGLQGSMGIPLPASTQWDVVSSSAAMIKPAYDELIRQAAQGEVLHNDDTGMRILTLMEENARKAAQEDDASDDRTGIFTTGIVALGGGRKVAVFFTGRQHAGENLSDVLSKRSRELPPPIQMCDGLSRNLTPEFEVILGNCLVHSRRKFVEVAPNFPDECRYVLETLKQVYHNEAETHEQALSAAERLAFHQAESKPLMDNLKAWLDTQLEQPLTEPNSGLGEAIKFMSKHWAKLTLFLREPGAPLDNNICERALKKAILHRKNALFYKTTNGAQVGDLFMSLIYTCQLNKVSPFDYLTELQRHPLKVMADSANWMPWNYTAQLSTDEAAGQ